MTDRINIFRKKATDVWVNVFWKHPAHLWALKVTVSIAFLLIPAELLFHNSFIGTTLALGVVAMSLGETDVHPRGRMKSAAIALTLFFVTSSIVELVLPFRAYFAVVLCLLVFSLIIAGGMNFRLQGVSFGALLILVYTMLGADSSEKWLHQPVLYTIGAFGYSVISILLLHYRPFRLLKEQLARGFGYLGEYIGVKADLFPSKHQEQVQIRNQLAQKNIELAQQIESCKNDLYSYSEESNPKTRQKVNRYYRKWFLLQEMQERATSSHEQYDVLSRQVDNVELIEGFGQLMRELAAAVQLYSESLLTDQPYKHPLSLTWTTSALQKMLETQRHETHYSTLSLLMNNLTGLEENLRKEEETVAQIDVSEFNTRRPERKRLKQVLTPHHPRFRFAVRLTLAMLLGYGIMYFFHIEKGAWILLTSLIVFQQTYSATRMRLFHRVLGTLFGVVLGVALAHLLPTLPGQILLLLSSIYLFYYWLKKNYTVAAIFITVFVLAAFNVLSDQGIAVMAPRIIDTLIGGVLAYLIVRFIWPDWQYKQLPRLLLNAVIKNKRYFESIYDGSVSEEDYIHNRRTAHNADNALTSAWKGMRLEPKSKRSYQEKAFNLTNLNHALLSYISAFGVHKSTESLSEKEYDFCRDVSHVLGFVSESLTNAVAGAEYEARLQLANRWEDSIAEIKSDVENRRMVLIYNIARVSRELLTEVREIHELYGNTKHQGESPNV